MRKILYPVLLGLLLLAVPARADHKNFKVSVYVRAFEVEKMKDTQWLESTWKTISSQLDVDKIYLETHRDMLLVKKKSSSRNSSKCRAVVSATFCTQARSFGSE